MRLKRITVDRQVMNGVPCIAGTRIPVATIQSLTAEGSTPTEIVGDYPQLTVDDIRAALEYAGVVDGSALH